MKTQAKLLFEMAFGLSLGLAAMSQVAHAADFNPQPDPPGKTANDKRLHNPQGFKGAVIDPNVKQKMGAAVDPDDKAVTGEVIGPNDKGAKGAVVDPNVKKK